MSITLLGGKSILSNVVSIAILGLGALTTCPLVEEPISVVDNTMLEEEASEEMVAVALPADDEDFAVEVENDSTTDEVTPPHTEVPQATTKPAINVPKSGDKVVITKEDPHGPASYNGMSRIQYEDAVKYTCPSQREVNIFETYQPAMSRLISIGKYSAYVGGVLADNDQAYNINDAPRALELLWDRDRINGGNDRKAIILVHIEDKIIKFYVDFKAGTVEWGKQDRDKVSSSIADMADFVASSWGNHLRSLESSYKSRCPND